MYTHPWKVQLPTNLDALHCAVGPTWQSLHAANIIRWNQCLDAQKMVCATFQPSVDVMSWIDAQQGYIPHIVAFTWMICHRIQNFVFHTCRAGRPYTACIIHGSEKRSRITQLPMQERKCLRFWQNAHRYSHNASLLFSFATLHMNQNIGLFRISKFLHHFLLRLTDTLE